MPLRFAFLKEVLSTDKKQRQPVPVQFQKKESDEGLNAVERQLH